MADEMMDKDPASAQTGLAEAGIVPADVRAAHDMAAFVQECPSMFHTAAAVRRRLDEAGFAYLRRQAVGGSARWALLHRAQQLEHHRVQGRREA